MKQPVEPDKDDCCNSGCNPCIFDVYENQLKLYENYKKSGNLPLQTENGIFQLEYTSFTVSNITFLCDSQKLISFKRNKNNELCKIWWNPGDHFLLKYCGDNISCTRAYTPLKLNGISQEDIDFSIILKLYNTGLVSKYLFNLEVGENTLWRGPYGSYEIEPNKYKRLIMIAQGTGIVTFISIIDKILNNEDDMTKIHLLYCCSSYDEILFRNELYNFKSFWNFTYEIFLNSMTKQEQHKYQEPITNGKLKYINLVALKPFIVNDQFLLCGSSNFMTEYMHFLEQENVLSQNIILF